MASLGLGGSWTTLASDIFDCCYLTSKLPRGGVYTFRTACVSKAGMGPYSSPSEQVLLGGPSRLGEPPKGQGQGGWGDYHLPWKKPTALSSQGLCPLGSPHPLAPIMLCGPES